MLNTNWLHLDLKGIVPSPRKICAWLDFFKSCGFNRIIFEYDCRVAWESWPGAGEPLLSRQDISLITTHAASLGLEVIPLIQIHGHLEWILKQERYAHLREAGFVNELCPQHPDSQPLIKAWIDEVLSLHPQARFIHLGADETWHLASCDLCQALAEADARRGKMGVYIDHVGAICRHVLGRGIQPMLWADMFCPEDRTPLAADLPAGTILANWQYAGEGPFPTTHRLQQSGLEVYGASAIQCSWYEHWWTAMNNPEDRLKNVLAWNQTGLNVIHTTWGRPGNLWNLYPCWAASVPVFIAAANPERWLQHPWRPFFDKLGPLLRRSWPHELKEAIPEAAALPAANPFEEAGRQWLTLGLRYQLMLKNHLGISLGQRCMNVTQNYVGRDPAAYHKYYIAPAENLQFELKAWQDELTLFFQQHELSDASEFIAEKSAIFQG